jgi:hypothetical protein
MIIWGWYFWIGTVLRAVTIYELLHHTVRYDLGTSTGFKDGLERGRLGSLWCNPFYCRYY